MKQFAVYLASLIFFFSSTVSAERTIYHWVDAQGKNHFADTVAPGEDSEEINLHEHNVLVNNKKNTRLAEDLEQGKALVEPEVLQAASKNKKHQAIIYQATITSPTDKESIRSNNGTLNIQVATIPEKENTHKLQLIMDGKKLGEPQISTTIGALNIDRGTHQIQAQLLAENGSILAKTQIVTIYLQRITVN